MGGGNGCVHLSEPIFRDKNDLNIYNCYCISHNSNIQQRAKKGGTVLYRGSLGVTDLHQHTVLSFTPWHLSEKCDKIFPHGP